MAEKNKGIPTYNELKAAHFGCRGNRITLERGEKAGCFYCLRIFDSNKITKWVPEKADGEGTTALCPYCGIDSVLGESYGYPIEKKFLKRMKKYWFS